MLQRDALHAKRTYGKGFVRVQFAPLHLKRQRTRQNFHRRRHRTDAHGTRHQQRRGAVLAAHRLQKPRQPKNMIPVVVRQQHGVQLVQADTALPQPRLGAFAAVDQQGSAVGMYRHARQRTAGQGLGAAGAGQGYLYQVKTSF